MTKAMLCFTFPIIRVIPVSGRVKLLLETPRAAWATLRLILLKAEGDILSCYPDILKFSYEKLKSSLDQPL